MTLSDPTACSICGRDACEDHLPSPDPTPKHSKPRHSLIGFSLDDLTQHAFPARKSILMRGETAIIREGHLGAIYALRGIGKTWCSQTLALVAASGTEALGFRATHESRVLYVDGEMAREDIQTRFALLSSRLSIRRSVPLTVVAADWQPRFLPRLDSEAGQAALEPFVDQAEFIILDNRSCLFDAEGEKDPTVWQAAQEWLLSLRRRGKTVLFDQHANRQGGARGHSKSEDVLDVMIKLSRPEGYTADEGARFLVEFDKTRGAHGSDVAPFVAHLTAEGWLVSRQNEATSAADKLRDYVRRAARAGEAPKSANAAIRGARVSRNAGLDAWADLLERGEIQRRTDGRFCAA